MDLLAKKRVLFVLAIVGGTVLGPATAVAGIYELSRVDYFKQGASRQFENERAALLKFSSDDLWAVHMTDGEGRLFLQRPPAVVTEFLNDPDRETGLRYLAWNEARVKQLEQAAAFLQELSTVSTAQAQR